MSLLPSFQAKAALIPPFRRYKLSQIPQHAGRLLVQGQQRPGEPEAYGDDQGGGDHACGAAGLPSITDYIAAYCARRGISGISDLNVYLAYNFFRLAAIFQGIAGRVRDGTAANPHAAMMERQVRPMAAKAWEFAKEAQG